MISPQLHLAIAQARMDDLRRAPDAHRLTHGRAQPARPATTEKSVTLRFASAADQEPLARWLGSWALDPRRTRHARRSRRTTPTSARPHERHRSRPPVSADGRPDRPPTGANWPTRRPPDQAFAAPALMVPTAPPWPGAEQAGIGVAPPPGPERSAIRLTNRPARTWLLICAWPHRASGVSLPRPRASMRSTD